MSRVVAPNPNPSPSRNGGVGMRWQAIVRQVAAAGFSAASSERCPEAVVFPRCIRAKVPLPLLRSMRPSASSRASARRTVEREMP